MDRSKRKGVLLSIKEILESKEFQCFYQQQDISKKGIKKNEEEK